METVLLWICAVAVFGALVTAILPLTSGIEYSSPFPGLAFGIAMLCALVARKILRSGLLWGLLGFLVIAPTVAFFLAFASRIIIDVRHADESRQVGSSDKTFEYRTADPPLSIIFPAQPEVRTEVLQTESYSVKYHMISANTSDGSSWVLTYARADPKLIAGRSARQLLRDSLAEAVKSPGALLVSSEEISLGKYPGIHAHVEFESGDLETRGVLRKYYADDNLYTLGVTMSQDKYDINRISSFLHSLKIREQ